MHRLKDSASFERVYRDSRSWATPLLVLRASPNDLPHSRIGYSVSKRIGKVVARNRLKRRMREAVRARLPRLAPGWDMVLIARAPSGEAAFGEIGQALDLLFSRAGLWAQRPPEGSTG
ncbi:MAG: ribonuclease P protein component [Chloroflexi bacterium]|nr:ribonuclease P protein component [Chloroflexota bacterium]